MKTFVNLEATYQLAPSSPAIVSGFTMSGNKISSQGKRHQRMECIDPHIFFLSLKQLISLSRKF